MNHTLKQPVLCHRETGNTNLTVFVRLVADVALVLFHVRVHLHVFFQRRSICKQCTL